MFFYFRLDKETITKVRKGCSEIEQKTKRKKLILIRHLTRAKRAAIPLEQKSNNVVWYTKQKKIRKLKPKQERQKATQRISLFTYPFFLKKESLCRKF